MRRSGSLAVYVTSHGFGHLNRTVAAINLIPPEIPVIIRSAPDLFDHWRDRLRRPADLQPHRSDAGASNAPGNSADTDGPATLERAALVHSEAMARIDEYTDELREGGVAAVLCDATPVPLVAARRAGIPGFLLSNFTWSEIYRPHANRLGGRWPRFVDEVRDAYRHASAIFRCAPHLRMAGIAPIIDIGLIVTPGRDRGQELRRRLGLPDHARLVYLYLGRYGHDAFEWHRLETLGELDVHFVGFHDAPSEVGPIANLHTVSALEWNGADLTASSDVVVAKAGYGTVSEAMASGTPMVYPPRTGFAEYRALALALNAWGGGVAVPRRRFDRLRIEQFLDRALRLSPGPPPFPLDGAATVASLLTRICGGESAAELIAECSTDHRQSVPRPL